ncbi:hypothetical protein [Microbacterium sp. SLBN-146]|uniref:hypothetical protein n=1 Tax=Microbacterium sp. SLBN-146 TaxID=2768457 RepID=UPI00114D5FC7|nr:hypothetical protein [Microbacterium sp. SLBN-146]TQJ31709.1 hypothetical protein FBY39_2191 [Microbacterium sp. SLBN-146]
MTRSRGPRVARGLAAASIATFVALLSHIAAGGGLPGPVGVVVPWTLAVLICIALVGRRLSVWRLSLSVVVSQVLFHVLFVLGSGSAQGAAPLGHDHGVGATALSSSGVAPGDIEMWIAHVIAGVATIALLHRGELVFRALLDAGAELAVVFRTGFVGVSPHLRVDDGPARLALVVDPAGLPPLGWDPRSEPRRGPPAAAVSTRLPIAAL